MSETVVGVLRDMKCPFPLSAHQIQGHDFPAIHPIIDWTDKNVHDYLKANDLPYHPLWEQGYISIGDTHTTRKLEDGMSEEETRFFGLKRECGLHEGTDSDFTI